MYASIRRYRATGSIDEAVRRVQNGFLPLVQNVPGLVSYTVVAAGETLASISIFSDLHAAEESNRLAALWVNQHLGDLVELVPQITSGPVLLHLEHGQAVQA